MRKSVEYYNLLQAIKTSCNKVPVVSDKILQSGDIDQFILLQLNHFLKACTDNGVNFGRIFVDLFGNEYDWGSHKDILFKKFDILFKIAQKMPNMHGTFNISVCDHGKHAYYRSGGKHGGFMASYYGFVYDYPVTREVFETRWSLFHIDGHGSLPSDLISKRLFAGEI